MPAAHHYAPPDAAAVQYSSKTVLLAKKEQENQTTEYHTYLHTLPAASTLLHRIRAIPLFVGIYRFYSPDPFFRGILTPASRQDQIPFLGYSFFQFIFNLFIRQKQLSFSIICAQNMHRHCTRRMALCRLRYNRSVRNRQQSNAAQPPCAGSPVQGKDSPHCTWMKLKRLQPSGKKPLSI